MKNYLVALTGSIYFLCTPCFGQQTLTIEATNFENTKGVAVVHLFREHDDLPGKPFLKSLGSIVNGRAIIEFSDLPFGDYAFILFQDENANGILDHKFGFPNEPMGFSNDWKLSLFSGMPNFKKLKFHFSAENSKCRIAIRQ